MAVRRAPAAPRAPSLSPGVPKVIGQRAQPTTTTHAPAVQPGHHYPYQVVNAPGGVYHVYANGQRFFVPANKPAAPKPPVAPASSSAGSAQVAANVQDQGAPTQDFTPDAQFYADQAKRTFDVNQKLSDYDAQDSKDVVDYQSALRQLAAKQPLEEQSARQSYNDRGLFYSGKLGESLNTLASSYAEQRANAAASLEANRRARTAAREALNAGASIDEAAALAAAADRQIGLDTQAADDKALVNEGTPKPAAKPKPVATARKPARRPRTTAQMRAQSPAMVARVKRRWRKAGRTA